MASKVEFEPTTEWVHEEAFDTIHFYLPGFEKVDLAFQTTPNRKLQVMGERQNVDEWTRFSTEIPIPLELDITNVTAGFGNGILHVKFPKAIASAPAEPPPKPATTSPAASKPKSEPQAQDQQQKTDASPKAGMPDEGTKPKQGDETPRKPEDDEQQGDGASKSTLDEDKKPKVAEKPDKGEKPASTKADDGAQKKTAAEKEESPKVDAADSTKTGPSETEGAPPEKPISSISGQEGKEKRKHGKKKRSKVPSGDHEEFTGGFLARMKQRINWRNSIVVVVLLVLMIGVYLKYAFGSPEERPSLDLPIPIRSLEDRPSLDLDLPNPQPQV